MRPEVKNERDPLHDEPVKRHSAPSVARFMKRLVKRSAKADRETIVADEWNRRFPC